MSHLKKIIIAVSMILLASCATPAGKLTEADFVSREIAIDLPVSKVAIQLREGFRYCGPESGGLIFVTHHGVPECMPAKEDGSILCDIYIGGRGEGRSGLVLGRIEMRPLNSGTAAVLRVQTYAANTDNILKSWELFLHDRAKEVCP